MKLAARRVDWSALKTPLAVVLLPATNELPAALRTLDTAVGGALSRSLEQRVFRGSRDEVMHIEGGGGAIQRVLLVGYGSGLADLANALRRAAAVAARQAQRLGVSSVSIWAGTADQRALEAIGIGAQLGAWEYTELKTPPPPADKRASLESIELLAADARRAGRAVASAAAIGEGYALARRLGMMPGNVCTPAYLAETAGSIAKRHRMRLTVLGRKEMQKAGMGAFLAVAQGSPEDPQLVVLEYLRGKKGQAPIALIGKGMCFDTGGISIKPAERMEWMKYDMCGAAGVLGALEAIGRLGLRTNVVGILGATTNMPSGTAYKPGDVVRASSGKTIEVINTDAEGRMVLADLLTYVKRFAPAVVVDAATLTGACVIALGNTATGIFATEDRLAGEVKRAAERAAEPGWQLPLWDDYREQIKSDVADIKNTGGRAGGAITAAIFLKEFVDGYPWAHLDIAGTAYSESDLGMMPRGPTGVPVGTFVEFVRGRVR
ncbi:MAG: leucyl aminopeptidase [Gemmatimonadaceae bacterium]